MLSLELAVNRLKEFHDKFNHPNPDKIDLGDKKLKDLRIELIREEFHDELIPALEANDPQKTLDALCDLLVVIIGAGVSMGLPIAEGFDEVMNSNMSKLGEDGKPILREDGKILKGPNYFKPNLKQFIE